MKTTRKLELIRGCVASLVAACAVSTSAQAPFTEVLDSGDLGDTTVDMGASWGDFDGDGDIDLYLASSGRSRPNPVYRNDGKGVFTRMTSTEIGQLAADTSDASMGVWVDIDNDGDLDLYVANYAAGDWDHPTSGPQGDVIYLNDGNHRFTRYAEAAFSRSPRFSNIASLVDYDRDGLLDVFISTWPLSGTDTDVLYHNDGAMQFSIVPSITGRTVGLGGSWADVDGDGDLDVIAADVRNNQPSYLYVSQSAQMAPGIFTSQVRFSNGVAVPADMNNGAAWGDVDNDGDLDFLTTHNAGGFDLYRNEGGGAFNKETIGFYQNPGSGAITWLDADNDGDLDILVGTIPTGSRAYFLLENRGDGTFEEQLILDGLAANGWRSMAVGDFDNDGFMDFYLVVSAPSGGNGRDRLFRNLGNDNHWLKLVLKGTESNASAIGAIVRVKATVGGAETWQMRQVSAGGETVWVQHDVRPNFGLGDATVAELVRIEWPSGTVQELTNVAADQILTVVEPPTLRMESGDRLSWPVTADGYQLESATRVDGPWSAASETVQSQSSRKHVTIQLDQGARFYRLHQL